MEENRKKQKIDELGVSCLVGRFELYSCIDEEMGFASPFGKVTFVHDLESHELYLPIRWYVARLMDNPMSFRTRRKTHRVTVSKLSSSYPDAMLDFLFTDVVLHEYGQGSRTRCGRRHVYMMRLDTFIHTLCSPVYGKYLVFNALYTLRARLSLAKTLMRLLQRYKPGRARALKQRLQRERDRAQARAHAQHTDARLAALLSSIKSSARALKGEEEEEEEEEEEAEAKEDAE